MDLTTEERPEKNEDEKGEKEKLDVLAKEEDEQDQEKKEPVASKNVSVTDVSRCFCCQQKTWVRKPKIRAEKHQNDAWAGSKVRLRCLNMLCDSNKIFNLGCGISFAERG